MGHILHDWNLDEKKMLISKAYHALNIGGHFVVYDSIIGNDRSQNSFGLCDASGRLNVAGPKVYERTWIFDCSSPNAHVNRIVVRVVCFRNTHPVLGGTLSEARP